jgi:hypothetical protein
VIQHAVEAPQGAQKEPWMDEEAALIILCDEDTSSRLLSVLSQHGIAPQASQRRNIDGSAAVSWMILASMAIRTAPDVLRALSQFLTRDRVRRIEFSGLTIDNPRPEDVDAIINGLSSDRRLPPKLCLAILYLNKWFAAT